MAEVQTHTESGEMTQRFIEFVMMHAQQAAFALGQIPHPQTDKGEVHLDMAKLFIDQLVMIRSKTRGNLSNEELGVLNNAISSLQMAFFEIAQAQGKGGEQSFADDDLDESDEAEESSETAQAESESPKSETATKISEQTSAAPESSQPSQGEGESKKKFTKSYGA